MIIDFFKNLMSSDIAIDLGTANTLVYVKGRGVVCNEPSVVAINTDTQNVIAVGAEAKTMLGRTPEKIMTIRPIKDGVIANYDITEKMLKHFIKKVSSKFPFARPKIVICIPSGVTQVEKKAVYDAAMQTGAGKVYIIQEPMAAAVGAKLPISEAMGNMIVDIGGGTTEVAVISLYGVVYAESARVGGDEMDNSIINYIKRKYSMMIGDSTAEQVKIKIGTAFPLEEELQMEIKGREIANGIPRTGQITSEEIREALDSSVRKIIDAVKIAFEKTPEELSADLVDRGIILTGGGALLKGLDKKLSTEIGLPVITSEEPLTSVVQGLGKILEDNNLLFRLADNK